MNRIQTIKAQYRSAFLAKKVSVIDALLKLSNSLSLLRFSNHHTTISSKINSLQLLLFCTVCSCFCILIYTFKLSIKLVKLQFGSTVERFLDNFSFSLKFCGPPTHNQNDLRNSLPQHVQLQEKPRTYPPCPLSVADSQSSFRMSPAL